MVALRASAALSVALLAALLLACSGCSSTSSCSRDADSATAPPGIRYGNTWVSARNDGPNDPKNPTRGPWFPFPPAQTVTFEHHLGVSPPQIAIWVAFHETGALAPSAGNISILEYVDKDVIMIKNDTCSQFFVWVEASIPVYSAQGEAGASSEAPPDTAGASGASGAP